MKRLSSLLLSAVLVLTLVGCGPSGPREPEDPGLFTLTFITIGKGDAFLLDTPGGQHYLLDTGKAEDYPQIARLLRVKGIDRLDGIFLTHGHKDHIGGLDTLLGAFPTDRVYFSGADTVTYTETDPRRLAETHGAEAVALRGGERLDLGGMEALAWLPQWVDTKNGNNNCLVLMLTHGDQRFLMMGDAELEEETALTGSGIKLRADLLKLGHHGETDATSPAFLDQVRPALALVAGNEAENPESVDPEMARRLAERDIQVLYSQCDGLGWDIISDGTTLTVETVEDSPLPRGPELSLREVDRKAQRVTVANDGTETADLTGCLLVSTRGDEHFLFPQGCLLEPGQQVTVACSGHEETGDLVWALPKVWKKKNDSALLYDRNLNLLAEDPA